MDTEQLITILDSPAIAREWFQSISIKDMRQAHDALTAIAESGMTLDLVAITAAQLEHALPQTAKPDQALSYLAKFATLSRSPIALGSLWELLLHQVVEVTSIALKIVRFCHGSLIGMLLSTRK